MTIRFGALTLDAGQRRLTHDVDGAIHLTPKAFDLLVLLVADAPRVVKKAELHERLWPDTFVSDATLVGLIKEIRRAIDDRDTAAPIIRTAHGVGYAFAAPIARKVPPRPAVSRWLGVGGRRVVLSEGENVIGRDPSAAIVLDLAGVSRRHARIVVGEAGALLEDLGSKNGTSLGGDRLSGQRALRDGDRIQLGPALVIFYASASGLSTETLAAPSPSLLPAAPPPNRRR